MLVKYENVESALYTTQFSDFEDFDEMEKYIEAVDTNLNQKIDSLQEKYATVHNNIKIGS